MMSTTVLSDSLLTVTAKETQVASLIVNSEIDIVEFAKCDCCGLTEECTVAYIQRIRERYFSRWICGLCGEAVKDEIIRAERLISTEEALYRHMSFCQRFNSSSPPSNPTGHLISAMKQLLLRSLDSPRSIRSQSTPVSPVRKSSNASSSRPLSRSESCIPNIST